MSKLHKEWFGPQELAGLAVMPGTERGVRKKAKTEGWRSQKRSKGKGYEYHLSSLPEKTQAALLLQYGEATGDDQTSPARRQSNGGPDREALWAAYEQATPRQREEAQRRLTVLQTVRSLTENGSTKTAAIAAVIERFGIDRATYYRWEKDLKGIDTADWLPALMPRYKRDHDEREMTPEAWDYFKADYLRLEAPSIAACYHRLERAAEQHGWEIVSYRTIQRRVEEIPATIRTLKRQGEIALMQHYPPMERSVEQLHALEWINGDGYQHNVFVKWPDGTIARPKTWFWQDVYSRKVLSYRVDLTENTDTIRLSYGDLVEQFGIPSHATIDNTRAAANKWMTGGTPNRYRFKVKEDEPLGIFKQLGTQPHWTTVNKGGTQAKGHGQAKPIERLFGVGGFGEYIDKHPDFHGAYTGPNPNAKPENYGATAIPLEKFIQVLNEEIIHWNAKPGRRGGMAGGVRSYNQVFDESYRNAPITKATEAQRRLWLLAAESITVRRDGTFTLAAGAQTGLGREGRNRYFAPELMDLGERRQKIVVRFDPDYLHESVHTYTLDGRYIGRADCIEAQGFGDTEAGRAWNRARRDFIKQTKRAAAAEVRMDLADISQRMPRPDLPDPVEAKIVRPARSNIEQPAEPDPNLVRQSEAAMLRFKPQQQEEPTPADRYQRWHDIDRALANGEPVSEADAKWHTRYQDTSEFRGQKRMEESFGQVSSAN